MNEGRCESIIGKDWHVVLSCPFCRQPVQLVPSDEARELLNEALEAWPNQIELSFPNPHTVGKVRECDSFPSP